MKNSFLNLPAESMSLVVSTHVLIKCHSLVVSFDPHHAIKIAFRFSFVKELHHIFHLWRVESLGKLDVHSSLGHAWNILGWQPLVLF